MSHENVRDAAIKSTGQGKLFNRPVLEALTKTNPMLHVITYGSITLALLYYSFRYTSIDTLSAVLVFASGVLFWTFFEYIMHRFLFHIALENKYIQRFRYMVHGVHHEFPRDKERVFMPPVPGMLIIAVLGFMFFLAMGQYMFIFLAGHITGYMAYSLLHYYMHASRPPRFLNGIWKHHNLHHYKYPEHAFGVSSPLWDYVFGTMPPNEIKGGKDVRVTPSATRESHSQDKKQPQYGS